MYIEVNNTTLFFDVYGSQLQIHADSIDEKPTLIMLHGGHGFADHTLYVEFWSQFQDLVQVIFLDQRGCGRSDPAKPSEWNLQQWANDLHQFCVQLGITKPILAGVSMGGHVMCDYMRHYANDIGGLIFCNTEARFILKDVCNRLREVANDEVAQITYDHYTNPTAETTAAYTNYCIPYYAHTAYTPTEIARCRQQLAVFEHYMKNEMLTFDYQDDMHKITCPTLFLVGNDSPFHLPIRAQEMASDINKQWVTMQCIEHAGAAVYKDQPELSEQIVRKWLAKINQ